MIRTINITATQKDGPNKKTKNIATKLPIPSLTKPRCYSSSPITYLFVARIPKLLASREVIYKLRGLEWL